jgi:hypothetical protein
MTPFEMLTRLSGRWSGRGRGQYPTIKPFEFAEETSFQPAPEYPMLRYEQRAWLLPGRESSHWELGLWRVVDGSEIEVSNAQDSGRVGRRLVVLRCHFTLTKNSPRQKGGGPMELGSLPTNG